MIRPRLSSSQTRTVGTTCSIAARRLWPRIRQTRRMGWFGTRRRKSHWNSPARTRKRLPRRLPRLRRLLPLRLPLLLPRPGPGIGTTGYRPRSWVRRIGPRSRCRTNSWRICRPRCSAASFAIGLAMAASPEQSQGRSQGFLLEVRAHGDRHHHGGQLHAPHVRHRTVHLLGHGNPRGETHRVFALGQMEGLVGLGHEANVRPVVDQPKRSPRVKGAQSGGERV